MESRVIINQFDYFAHNGVKNVKIADELFVLNPRHFERVCDLIIERGMTNIWCCSCVDTCKPRYLEKLKRAGLIGWPLEKESNTKLRTNIHKGGLVEVSVTDLIGQVRNRHQRWWKLHIWSSI